jgi:thiol-disulfide isomerase/thioredoxin
MNKKWKRVSIEMLLVLGVLVGLHAYQTRSHPRGKAPRAVAQTLDGKTITLGATSEKPVLVHFWATWCGVCRLEESSVISIAKRVRVISVASHSGSASEVQRYVRAASIAYPVINDPTGELARRYGVTAYPSSFFVRGDGTIETSETGYTTYLGLWARAFWAGL